MVGFKDVRGMGLGSAVSPSLRLSHPELKVSVWVTRSRRSRGDRWSRGREWEPGQIPADLSASDLGINVRGDDSHSEENSRILILGPDVCGAFFQ